MKCVNFNEFKCEKKTSKIKKNKVCAEKIFSDAYYASDIKEKIKLYTIGIKLNPYFIDAYFNRAELYKKLKKYNKAIDDYKRAAIEFTKAIHEDPNDSEAYQNRAFAYYNLKRYSPSIKDYSNAIKLTPENKNIYLNRGTYIIK
ncbi:tetratricopeptide repeat protein [Clostridium sp. Marseille-Q2269]|uniref:tetratricopeptide repeat protein n=1 Tax=Clostridium sp. Marseille-Q2269 TaxID=2942205 RepID=UPI002072E347|nr:tetratricopeptide repeat protein [Clostridium sp. Marseille-Q2269]